LKLCPLSLSNQLGEDLRLRKKAKPPLRRKTPSLKKEDSCSKNAGEVLVPRTQNTVPGGEDASGGGEEPLPSRGRGKNKENT